VGEGAGQLLSEGEVDAFIGSVSVGLGTNETKRDDLSLGVHLLELSEEGDRTSHSVRASLLSVPESSSSFHDTFEEPGAEFSHAPSLSLSLGSAGDLGVVRNILGHEVHDGLVGIIGVDFRGKSDGETHGGGWTAHITGSLNWGKSSSTGNGHVGSPGVVEVHLVDTFFRHALDTIVDVVLLEHTVSTELSHTLSFLFEELWDLALQSLTAHASLRVVNAIEEVTHDTGSLGYNSTDFTRVVSTLGSLDLYVDTDDTTERGGHPELVPVESTGVHAEHNVGNADSFLGDVEELHKSRASRLFFSLEDKGEPGVGETLDLEVLDSETDGEWGVTIVSSTTTVEEISLNNSFSGV